MSKNKLKTIQAELETAFPERRALVTGSLTALLAREHLLMLGPPGTAKSLFARTFAEAVADGSFFDILLTKFTTPEEVFGPVSFKGLKEDRYERILDGYAGSSRVVLFDEIWKASSAILNANLTLMNERIVRSGIKQVKTPLELVFGASNEYPQDDSLAALFDRFAVKYWVDYLSDMDNMGFLLATGGAGRVMTKLTGTELSSLRDEVAVMKFSDANIGLLLSIKAAVENEGFRASDRTWVKAVNMIKAHALLNERDAVIGSDFLILTDMLWKEHKDRDRLLSVVGNAADPYGSRAEAIVDGTKAAMGELPSIDLLKSGQMKKTDMIAKIAEASGKVAAERDKLGEIEKEAAGNFTVTEAVETVETAQGQIDTLMQEVIHYRGASS